MKSIENISESIEKSKSKIDQLYTLFTGLIDKITYVPEAKDAYIAINSKSDPRSPMSIEISIPSSLSLGENQVQFLIYDLLIFFNILENEIE